MAYLAFHLSLLTKKYKKSPDYFTTIWAYYYLDSLVFFCCLNSTATCSRNSSARINIVNMAIKFIAYLIGYSAHFYSIQLAKFFVILFCVHDAISFFAVAGIPFSTGAPTRFPHSVHEPS